MSETLPKPFVCGHRGASGHAPENTMAAFRLAQKMGATWLEFDVQLSADGIPIILHDDTLERTTSLAQPLKPSDLTRDELKELDAGSWFSDEYRNERLPTLDEVLQEFGQVMGLNIEIKSRVGVEVDNGLEQKIAQSVRRFNLQERVVISSFDPFRLTSLHRYDPELRLGALYTGRAHDYPAGFDPFLMAHSFEAVALHPPRQKVNAKLIEQARRENLEVNTWTVNEEADMQRLIGLGVDMIITNYPDRLVNLLAR